MFPYSILSPPYDHASAGIRALYKLKDSLIKNGCYCRINQTWDRDFIAVYPEIVWGNPLNAKHKVRWILNVPGKVGGPLSYEDELLFTWDKSYYNLPDDHVLKAPLIEDFFNPYGVTKRSGGCFYIGRSIYYDPKEVRGLTEITHEWPPTRFELAELLRRSKYFVTYDPNTLLQEEARLCGCIVYKMSLTTNPSRSTITNETTKKDYPRQLSNFIRITQKYAGS